MLVIPVYSFKPLKGSNIYGLAVWPFIFFQFSREEHLSDPRKRETMKHELQHIYQCYRYWVVFFPFVYFWSTLRGWIKYGSYRQGYINNKFEVEARLIAKHDDLTEDELKYF